MNSNESTNILDNILNDALNRPLEVVSPSFKQNAITDLQVQQILDIIVARYPTLTKSSALIAIILLFLKGASSNNTPENLGVEIDGITVTKRDIKNALQSIINNQYLRRLAETIAVQIGKFAERNQLDGELAGRLSKMVSEDNMLNNKNQPPLTINERAWSSSFSQAIKNLSEYTTPRVVNLLALDYSQRFGKNRKKSYNK